MTAETRISVIGKREENASGFRVAFPIVFGTRTGLLLADMMMVPT